VILLTDLVSIDHPENYKVHLANWNGHNQPLDVFVQDREQWKDWNSWRADKNDFNRQYIFSVIDYYHEPNTWLFGGVYEVLTRGPEKHAHSYEVELTNQFKEMIGRLKIYFARPGRAKSLRMENYLDQFSVSELLKAEYTGEVFCGYENINHDFTALESIFMQSKSDWKAALENVKGVYLITDKSNGKRYVGSAYGESGIWSRWSCYVGTGHGWNDELTKLIKKNSKDYARENFVFTLLEYRAMKTDDQTVIDREGYWKEVMLSRGEYGYNKN
jgi:hypothetical protein